MNFYSAFQSSPKYNMSRITNEPKSEPFVEIIEQPSSKGLRFRYECEGRSAGSINGSTSTAENKTYPAIKIHNAKGPCVLVVSCVTHDDDPPKPHPHSLVGAECDKGVYTKKLRSNLDKIQLKGLGIQCVKKKEVTEALGKRQKIRVDPYRTGFDHSSNSKQTLDLNSVKLCFQVFLHDEKGKYTKIVPPVCSNTIKDKKSATELNIEYMSTDSASPNGREELVLLTGKLPKSVKVRFRKMEGSRAKWQGYGSITKTHQNCALVVQVPRYHDPTLNRREEILVDIGTDSPGEGEWSEPRTFYYLAQDEKTTTSRKRKVNGYDDVESKRAREEVPGTVEDSGSFQSGDKPDLEDSRNGYGPPPVISPYPHTGQIVHGGYEQQQQQQQPNQMVNLMPGAYSPSLTQVTAQPKTSLRGMVQSSDSPTYQQGQNQLTAISIRNDEFLSVASEDGKTVLSRDKGGQLYVSAGPQFQQYESGQNQPQLVPYNPDNQSDNLSDLDLLGAFDSGTLPSNASEHLLNFLTNTEMDNFLEAMPQQQQQQLTQQQQQLQQQQQQQHFPNQQMPQQHMNLQYQQQQPQLGENGIYHNTKR